MKKKLTEAQKKQRRIYSAAMSTPKTHAKRRGEASALNRVTGLSTTR